MRIIKFLMFNHFVKLYLNINHSFLEFNKRYKSNILEMWNIMSIFFSIIIIFMIPTIALMNYGLVTFESAYHIFLIPFNLMLIALLNKDFFGGQSVVHRQLGYKVIDAKSNIQASKMQCMLRNITAPIWIIESIFLLVNSKRRLGDIIAGTSLIEVEPTNPELILNEIKNVQFDKETKITLLVSIIWSILFTLLF